jgi:hypothetical protein
VRDAGRRGQDRSEPTQAPLAHRQLAAEPANDSVRVAHFSGSI